MCNKIKTQHQIANRVKDAMDGNSNKSKHLAVNMVGPAKTQLDQPEELVIDNETPPGDPALTNVISILTPHQTKTAKTHTK